MGQPPPPTPSPEGEGTSGRIEPRWISELSALAIHDRQLAEHGGPAGVRDAGAFESALSRPRNRWAYGEDDLLALAAAYAFGVARNHPFVDGNKRTAWTVARVFLIKNRLDIGFDEREAIDLVQSLAAGELSEAELAEWLRDRIAQPGS